MSSIKLGDKKMEEYVVPDIRNLVRCFRSETLFIFGIDSEHTDYRWCLGVGKVIKIKKGENFDLLYLNFGRKYAREIIVQYNHARRQLLTLKRGQYATFYGKFRFYLDDSGKSKTTFYAYGLQAWYVPRMLDIKQMNLDEEQYDDIDQEQENETQKMIDDLLGGKK